MYWNHHHLINLRILVPLNLLPLSLIIFKPLQMCCRHVLKRRIQHNTALYY